MSFFLIELMNGKALSHIIETLASKISIKETGIRFFHTVTIP